MVKVLEVFQAAVQKSVSFSLVCSIGTAGCSVSVADSSGVMIIVVSACIGSGSLLQYEMSLKELFIWDKFGLNHGIISVRPHKPIETIVYYLKWY